MTTSLKTIWALWEKAEIKGWESAKPEKAKPDPTPPKKEPSSSYERPKAVDAQKETPSGLNSLENEESFIPGDDDDASTMQLKTTPKLEEAFMEMLQAMEKEIEEAFMTPDVGVSNNGLGLLGGGIGLSIGDTYDRNYCPDPAASEETETAPSLDPSNNILAPRQFIPREDRNALAEHMAHSERLRRSKLQS